MPYPTWTAGQRITAALLTSMQPLIAYKTSTTSRSSTTTIATDPDLSLSVEASALYSLQGLLVFNGGAGSDDLRIGWTAPTSATLAWVATGQNTSATTSFGSVITDAQTIASTAFSLGTIANTNGMTAMVRGLLTTSTTAGTFALQWAQFTSSATATTMLAGSHISLQRLS